MKPLRVVIDTNLVLSALVFGSGTTAALRQAWQSGAIIPLLCKATAGELIRVLAYPKFKLDGHEQQDLLADYLPWCESVRIPNPPPLTPHCRDAHDRIFLELAAAGGAEYLVTGDADLLDLASRFTCPIITVAELVKRMAARPG